MWRLWIKKQGVWTAFASFEERIGDYAAQVKEGIVRALQSKNEDRRSAASVMQSFVLTEGYYPHSLGKKVRRALRHFDEVGLSNDICVALEEALEVEIEGFALAKDGENVNAFKEIV